MTISGLALKPNYYHLVLDSSPLITNSINTSYSGKFWTIPQVIEEIKDKETCERINKALNGQSSLKLYVRDPSPKAMILIKKQATITGDISVLSEVDLKVAALTLTLEL